MGQARAEAHAEGERKRRRLTVALAAAVLLMVLVGGSGVWMVQRQQQRRSSAEQDVLAAVQHQREPLDAAWQAHDLAKLKAVLAEADRALAVASRGDARDTVLAQAVAFQHEAEQRLRRAASNNELRQAVLDVSVPEDTDLSLLFGRLDRVLKSVDEQYLEAFRRCGLDVDRVEDEELVQRLQGEPDIVVGDVVAALDQWMRHARQQGAAPRWRRLLRLAERLDQSEQRRQLRALLVGDGPRVESVVGLLSAPLPWPALGDLGRDQVRRRQQLRSLREQFRAESEPVLTVLLLAQVCEDLGEAAAAEEVLRRSLAVRPDEVVLLSALGKLLERQGRTRLAEAIECYRAIRVRHRNLGVALAGALVKAVRMPEAELVIRDLVRQQPDNPDTYLLLGTALEFTDKLPEAEAAYRKAISLQPALVAAHYNLGVVLQDQDKLPEAEAAFRKAISLQPSYDEAHCDLGVALQDQKKLPEAEAAFRKAIALQPAYAEAHGNLGETLYGQKKLPEAEAAFRKAISLQPDLAEAHSNLGRVLQMQNKLPEAEAALRKAISLQPALGAAHCYLGIVFGRQTRLQDAVTALEKGYALLGDSDPSRQWFQRTLLHHQRQVSLDTRLPAILEGTDQPVSAAEQLELAQLCHLKKLYAASVRFHRAAFAADSKLAMAGQGHRYNAACCAALAGCGQGKDADSLDDTERAGLRQQAGDWLRADLSGWSRTLDRANPQGKASLAQRMQIWRNNPNLAGVRNQANLAKLPQTERIAWQKLWDDVAALQRRAAAR